MVFHSNITLCGLVHFIAETPHLQDLTLNFDASDAVAAWDSCEDVEITCKQLYLWPGGSRILDASAVSNFLDKTIPCIELEEDDGWGEHEDPEGFKYRREWVRVALHGASSDSDAT